MRTYNVKRKNYKEELSIVVGNWSFKFEASKSQWKNVPEIIAVKAAEFDMEIKPSDFPDEPVASKPIFVSSEEK